MNTDKLKKIKCLLLDMDGTIYIAKKLFPFTNPFLDKMKNQNIRTLFLTNNSSISSKDYLLKLKDIGVSAEKDGVFSSADATKVYLKDKGFKKIYLMATESLEEDFKDDGFTLTNEKADAVVLAFDKTLNYEKLVCASNLLFENVPFIATHPDFVCPYEPYPIPDTGSMIRLFEAATGKSPTVIGKPSKMMFESIVKKYGLKKEEVAMVGDRLMTDVRFAKDNGILSILVLSGETTKEMHDKSDIKADLVFENIKELGEYL